jgi:hypothetical protein
MRWLKQECERQEREDAGGGLGVHEGGGAEVDVLLAGGERGGPRGDVAAEEERGEVEEEEEGTEGQRQRDRDRERKTEREGEREREREEKKEREEEEEEEEELKGRMTNKWMKGLHGWFKNEEEELEVVSSSCARCLFACASN